MKQYLIKGPNKGVSGTIECDGSKNSCLPLLASSILFEDSIVLTNVPLVKDVLTLCKLLEVLGSKVKISEKNKTIKVINKKKHKLVVPYKLISTMRAGALLMGALLGKYPKNKIFCAASGGCSLGARPTNFHIAGFKSLGAKYNLKNGYTILSAKNGLIGNTYKFPKVSVTGTSNLILASVLANGITTLKNISIEPEVLDLANCLISMGAKIEGAGSDIINIEGVDSLNGTSFSVMPDRVEVGTYLTAVAMTGGNVKIKSAIPEYLSSVITKLESAGAIIKTGEDWVEIIMELDRPLSTSLTTGPYPSFPTDMQAQFVALNSIAKGNSTVTETVFENRFMHVQEIARMGGDITLKGNTAVIEGIESLKGAPVMATDLRASASLVLAGLVAEGSTTIDRIYHIDRGYERIEEKLKMLGADIERIS